ncbi:MAG: hypothetical protein OET90_02205 [Desulfuromonadales bacterium]|nr:hypothetical protein [Desulfuromonadales bacterium]
MYKMKLFTIVFCCLGLICPSLVMAQNFDGKTPMLCALVDVNECHPGEDCQRFSAASVGLPTFVKVDVEGQVLRSADPDTEKVTAIKSVARIDGNIILQGAEDGDSEEDDSVGWTLSIDQESGKMIFSASRELAGFVVFGSCVELD